MAKKVNYSGEYVRSYQGMRGVDLTNSEDSLTKRYGYLENMYVDYEGGGDAVESIPGFRLIASLGGRINGIFSQSLGEGREYLIVHAGTQLFRLDIAERDALGAPAPIATMADLPSRAFSFDGALYILDGDGLLQIDRDGNAGRIGENGTVAPYVPLTTKDGVAFEKRNMLTSAFRSSYFISAAEPLTYGTAALSYSILDAEEMTCTVTGLAEEVSGRLYIPSYADIGGKRYLVTEIARLAFRGAVGITCVITNRGLRRIGLGAFWGMSDLTEAYISDTVEELGDFCFYNCSSLSSLYLGLRVAKLGYSLLSGCLGLSSVDLAADSEGYAMIEGAEALGDRTLSYNATYDGITVALPLSEDTLEVESLTLGGVARDFLLEREERRVRLTVESRALIEGHSVELKGRLAGVDAEPDLIGGCRISELFDGRVFLSGNPACPSRVFYCGAPEGDVPTPLYFPADFSFTDGVAGYGVSELLSTAGTLAVFKSGDDGSGSVFYHSKEEGYPVEWVHGGVICRGGARVFLDDAVFLTDLGLFALERTGSDGTRTVRSRSATVGPLLLSCDKSDAALTEWRGYLVLLLGDRMLLGDSRDRFNRGDALEYEWYPLSGIGYHVGDSRVYRYAEEAPEGFVTSDRPNEVAEGTVMSVADPNAPDLLCYYVEKDGERVAVYPTEEMAGGRLSPATAALGYRDLLFFGTESGELCLFNSDKRGVAPDFIKDADFDEEEYRARMGKRIHPYFYDFALHASRYALSTGADSCDLPYLTKSSLRGSLTLEIKNMGGSIDCEVGTDRGGYRRLCRFPAGTMTFAEGDLSTIALDTRERAAMTIPEGERDWISKEITVYSEGYRAPIGVRALHYRYRIKGRIKNRKGSSYE